MDNLCEECERLRAENARLTALLEQHGIPWEPAHSSTTFRETAPHHPSEQQHRHLHTAEKVALFRALFRGRNDVYPVRWESAKGKSGYAPACANEWRAGVCGKPSVKCADCEHRQLLPVTDQVIYDHLAGKHTIGVYPLLPDDTCHFLAADFDEADWRGDSHAFLHSCRELGVPAALEISRSGKGAHAWIFFTGAVSARDARQLGAAIISHTCARTRQLALSSYDRFFPNQDTLPKGGFGNLIALPLQKKPRKLGRSVFVDDQFIPWPDQWAFIASLEWMCAEDIEAAILKATGGRHPLDVAFVEDEDNSEPWKRHRNLSEKIQGPLPESVPLVLANQIFVAKADLPQPLANRLIRLAAFQNPEFYKAQAMRLPVWNKPRIIGCAENFGQHIGLPRGCLDAVLKLLEQNNIHAEIRDERVAGSKFVTKFTGELRADQKAAVKAMMKQEVGVLCAPTAFGKTITAAALIARRKVSTLILVHRTELLRQ
jgi:hypothetical protein